MVPHYSKNDLPLAGKSAKISSDGIILPYPFEGQFYAYDDPNIPLITSSFDSEDSEDIL